MTENTSPEPSLGMSATFIEPGTQLQTAFIGLEPAILIRPEYDPEANEVDFVTTVVGMTPRDLVSVLETLLDGAKTMVETDLEALEQRLVDDSEG